MARERRLAFGEVAEVYDRARPSYPTALVDDALEFAAAGEGDRALEVGAGTGKATALFAARGLTIVALEPSAAMAEVARRNCAGYEQVTIVESDFERWSPAPAGGYRLLFSGQAWHWIAPELGYVRAREALEDGGALAAFWNSHRWETCALRGPLIDAYRRTVPDFGADPGPAHPTTATTPERRWTGWNQELADAGGFSEPVVRSYRWSESYTTAAYVELLRTHSDHILLGRDRLSALLDAVAAVIDHAGGTLELEYATALLLARATGGGAAAPG